MNNKDKKLQIYLIVIFIFVFITANIAEAAYWEIIDLEPFDGDTHSYAVSINERGQVAGWSTTAADERHAFLWSKETGMINIGAPEFTDSQARDLNNLGQVTGLKYIPYQSMDSFIWTEEDGMVILETGNPAAYEIREVYAHSINDNGQIVGSLNVKYETGHTGTRAFIWDQENGLRDLNDLVLHDPNWIIKGANDINNNGQIIVTGYVFFSVPDIVERGFAGVCSVGTNILEFKDDNVNFYESNLTAINDLGQVVAGAWYAEPHMSFAAYWENDGFVSLGSLLTEAVPCFEDVGNLSEARDINILGKVVGVTATDFTVICEGPYWDSKWDHAFIWDQKNEMIDLNDLIPPDSGWELRNANSINGIGQIAGSGRIDLDGDGEFDRNHAFLLTPPPAIIIRNILEHFNNWVDQGLLVGDGPGNSANNQLNAFRKMLVKAGDMIDSGNINAACNKLDTIYKKCDSQPKPKDSVAGPAVSDFYDMILVLMEELGCE